MYRRMSPNNPPGQSTGHGTYRSPGQDTTWQMTPLPMQTPPLPMQAALEQQPQMQQQMEQVQQIPPASASLEQLIAQGPTMQDPDVKFTNEQQMQQLGKINGGMPITGETLQYLNGFLRTQIGRRVKVEFLIGTNTLTDRTGILLAVGINYIVINETDTDDLTACDFYNIKFVTFYY